MDKKPERLTPAEMDQLDIEAAEKSLAELGENITLAQLRNWATSAVDLVGGCGLGLQLRWLGPTRDR